MAGVQVKYSTVPSPTVGAFHMSQALVRGIMGPYGSAKSTGCVMDMYMRAHNLTPCRDGIRRARFVVIRSTYAELKSTTIKTFLEWLGPKHGLPNVVYDTPIRWNYFFDYKGKAPNVDMEILFLSADRPDDVKKLRGIEITGAWLNEASELPREVLEMVTARIGRYPHAMDRPDNIVTENWPSWKGVMMDTNAPDDDHWYYRLAEVDLPDGYEFFRQPGGFSPYAENIPNLPGGRNYYTQMAAGKSPQWVKIFIDAQYGSTSDGRPVFPEFNEERHVAKEPLKIMRGMPLYLGFDYGLMPACAAMQLTPTGGLRVLREWATMGGTMGIRQFMQTVLQPALASEFAGMQIRAFGDPGGHQRSQNDEKTAMDIQAECGMAVKPTITNVFMARRDALAQWLTRMNADGAAFLLDPSCAILRKALNGSYKYRRIAVAGSERYTDAPDKNDFSHLAEAAMYACQGVGVAMRSMHAPIIRKSSYRPVDATYGY